MEVAVIAEADADAAAKRWYAAASPYATPEALREALAKCVDARNNALEKAARVCESLAIPDGITDCVPYWDCATAIRALKEAK